MRKVSPSYSNYILYGVIGVIGFVALFGAVFGLIAFILEFARTGSCDKTDVCKLVSDLTTPIVNLEVLDIATAGTPVLSTAYGDAFNTTDPSSHILCYTNETVLLVRATPSGSADLVGDVAHVWFGSLDAELKPILTSFPADGKSHAVSGLVVGPGNRQLGVFAVSDNGRREHVDVTVYLEDCAP